VSGLATALSEHGSWLIASNVFLQQIGVPIPAEPTLVVAGSLAARGRLSVAGVIGVALVATLVADLTWFVVGRRYGARALRLVSSSSSSSAKYVSLGERLFARWGPAAFALAKFIPGLPMVGPVLAGGLGASLSVFVVCDVLAMTLWAGAFTGLGMIFQRHVERALGALDHLGSWGVLLGVVVVVVGVALRVAHAPWSLNRGTTQRLVEAEAAASPSRADRGTSSRAGRLLTSPELGGLIERPPRHVDGQVRKIGLGVEQEGAGVEVAHQPFEAAIAVTWKEGGEPEDALVGRPDDL